MNVLAKEMKTLNFFTILTFSILSAQNPDWEKDFVFAKSASDTVYLVEDDILEGSHFVFHSKNELYQYFSEINFDKTGEITNEYQISVEETPARYIAKDELVEESYRNFCQLENIDFPSFFNVNDFWDFDETEKEKFLNYLTEKWEVPVNFYMQWTDSPSAELIITENDWRKKEFLNKMNGLLDKAFRGKSPLNFSFNGINSEKYPMVSWKDFDYLEIKRETKELIVKTNSGVEMKFPYSEDQYSDLADFHVNFLAFYKIMLDLNK